MTTTSVPAAAAGIAAGRAVQAVLAGCLVLSAFLLFLVQPIIAKQLMPWFGGSSAVWTTAMMFFQLALLAGYVYSDVSTRWLQPRARVLVHVGLLAMAVLALPIAPTDALRPDPQRAPVGQLLWTLLATVGLPYFCLATTGPLLQAWYSRLFPQRRVYRLFALSNAASLVALLAYPFAIEPFSTSAQQSRAWSVSFCVFALLCAASAWVSRSVPTVADDGAASPEAKGELGAPTVDGCAPTWRDDLRWLVLSTTGSMFLVAVTSHITQNIAPIPFLWVLPLFMYLLTFILCFEGAGWYRRSIWTAPLILFVAAMAWAVNVPAKDIGVEVAIPLYVLGMFVCCMFCHGELSQRKPAAAHLTRFYLWLSVGGAVGGIAISALAPAVFSNYYELPLLLVAFSVLMLWVLRRYLTANKAAWVVLVLALGACVVCVLMAWLFYKRHSNGNVSEQRNFYAASQVSDFRDERGKVERMLYNGAILHGTQRRSPGETRTPTTYYGAGSGVALAMRHTETVAARHVGVIGLGVGTMSAWGRAGDAMRFYEINPHSHQIAERDFSYLRESPAQYSVVMGDARLALEAELRAGRRNQFDVLVVDAFSGDSIPVHLMTREAMALYRQHLKPGGIIAYHVSNLYLELAPVVARLATDAGLGYVKIFQREPKPPETSSIWVLVTADRTLLDSAVVRAAQAPLSVETATPLWTDRRNNLFDVLR